MEVKIFIFLIGLAFCVAVSDAVECCKAYNDSGGNSHPTQLCESFCCFGIPLENSTQEMLRDCCSDINRRVPGEMRDSSCVSWIKKHMSVVVVASVLALVFFVAICACCCCCGCCRNSHSRIVFIGARPGWMKVSG